MRLSCSFFSVCRFILLTMIHKRTFFCCVSAWMSTARRINNNRYTPLVISQNKKNNDNNNNALWRTTPVAILRGGDIAVGYNGRQQHSPTRMYATTAAAPIATDNNNNSSKMPAKEQEQQQQQAAEDALSIFGSSLKASSFCGIPFLDTSRSNEFRVLFILGGPGAGKGTQSANLLEHYPCVHLSAGELLREEATKEDSPHQKLIQDCLVSGKIVPVEISLSLLENAMKQARGKSLVFLIDGFPRNYDNLDGWARCMSTVANVFGTLVYQCPLEELERRILSRAKDGSGRSDDNLKSAQKRFVTFEGETVPVVDTLRLIEERQASANLPALRVVDIQGDQSREQVWHETQTVMNSFIAHDVLTSSQQLIESIKTQNLELYQKLCADEWFEDSSPQEVMTSQEGDGGECVVSNAKLNFISGTKVSVEYDRTLKDNVSVRETRIWSHRDSQGWQNIHFSRTPKE